MGNASGTLLRVNSSSSHLEHRGDLSIKRISGEKTGFVDCQSLFTSFEYDILEHIKQGASVEILRVPVEDGTSLLTLKIYPNFFITTQRTSIKSDLSSVFLFLSDDANRAFCEQLAGSIHKGVAQVAQEELKPLGTRYRFTKL